MSIRTFLNTAAKQSRTAKVLRHIDRAGNGLEIGPSHNPVAPKKSGYRVHIIDHLSREDLIRKYTDHGVVLDNIEEVDFVWSGEPFAELTKRPKFYDWIIASHVIEHTPDLIGFLAECDSILKDSGVVSLAVPDARFAFDCFRPLTGIAPVLDAHERRAIIHSAGTAADYFLNVVKKGNLIAWNNSASGDYHFVHTPEEALEAMRQIRDEQKYLDVHAWCFTPSSFRLLMHDLHLLGLSPFREVSFSPTVGCEFFVTLGRNGRGPDRSRMELHEDIKKELAAPLSWRSRIVPHAVRLLLDAWTTRRGG